MGFWRGKRVLVTGHTGFKGSWLCLWLKELGAEVYGLALAPVTEPNLFTLAKVEAGLAGHTLGDVRDLGVVKKVMAEAKPEVVFHMAAQPLVRESYADPVGTYATNVLGTAHVLEAVRGVESVRVVVNVTTDKCYENNEENRPFVESDRLGGYDPYSSSKACSELVTGAFRDSFLRERGVEVATVRAGNVIGGGDWAKERLMTDLILGFMEGREVVLRYPHATRPWQHVLEPLAGYLMLAERLATRGNNRQGGAWNLGPEPDSIVAVGAIARQAAAIWGNGAATSGGDAPQPHEAQTLRLDITKAKTELGWEPQLDLATTLEWTVGWYRQVLREGADARALCLAQLRDYQGRVAKMAPALADNV